ncbi:MAG: hypothetical protein R2940_06050 [Syntrophotaleaceae bacterium]
MKSMVFLLTASMFLAGCASMEEAYYTDNEFGMNSQKTWDMQVAYPDYRYAYDQEGNPKNPQGLNGISVENFLKTYHGPPVEAEADISDIYVTE